MQRRDFLQFAAMTGSIPPRDEMFRALGIAEGVNASLRRAEPPTDRAVGQVGIARQRRQEDRWVHHHLAQSEWFELLRHGKTVYRSAARSSKR